jgi:hypothetical protein
MHGIKRFKRTLTGILATASVVLVGVGAMIYGTSSSVADEPGAKQPAAEIRLPLGTPAPATSKGVQQLSQLVKQHGIAISLNEARAVDAPASAGSDAAWTLARAGDGGVCVSTARVLFCGSPADIADGRASASEYPGDKIVSWNEAAGTASVTPSSEPGVRVGFAPPGSTSVASIDHSGRMFDTTTVESGLYQVSVPPQGDDGHVVFRDDKSAVLAARPAEG